MVCYLNYPADGTFSLVANEGVPRTLYKWNAGSLFPALFNAAVDVSDRTRSDFTGETYPVTSCLCTDLPEAKSKLTRYKLLKLHPLINALVAYTGKDSIAKTSKSTHSLSNELAQIYNDFSDFYSGLVTIEDLLLVSEPDNIVVHPRPNIYLANQGIVAKSETPSGYTASCRLFDDDGYPLDWNALIHQRAPFAVFSLYRIAILDLWAAMVLGQLSSQKICPYCGRLFTTQNPDHQIYCSAVCKSRHHETKSWPFRTGHDTINEFLRNRVNIDYEKKAIKLIDRLDDCHKLKNSNLRQYMDDYHVWDAYNIDNRRKRAILHKKPHIRTLLKRENILLRANNNLPAFPYYVEIEKARYAWSQFSKIVAARGKFKAEADALRQQACDAENDRLKEHIADMLEDTKGDFKGPWYYEEKNNPIHRKELEKLWTDIKKREDVR